MTLEQLKREAKEAYYCRDMERLERVMEAIYQKGKDDELQNERARNAWRKLDHRDQ